jgi:enamine deaminase RidA (YjgF/YER057c/UK114 family)
VTRDRRYRRDDEPHTPYQLVHEYTTAQSAPGRRQMRAVNASPRVYVCAGWHASAMEIRYLQPDGLVRSPAFSHAAVIPPGATTIYIGGQNGVDETGQVIASGDVAAQAARAVDNAETALRAAGATLADVVAWTVLIAAGADVAAAYGAIAPRLARAGAPPLVTAARVAGLAVPGALLEISAIAALTAD